MPTKQEGAQNRSFFPGREGFEPCLGAPAPDRRAPKTSLQTNLSTRPTGLTHQRHSLEGSRGVLTCCRPSAGPWGAPASAWETLTCLTCGLALAWAAGIWLNHMGGGGSWGASWGREEPPLGSLPPQPGLQLPAVFSRSPPLPTPCSQSACPRKASRALGALVPGCCAAVRPIACLVWRWSCVPGS